MKHYFLPLTLPLALTLLPAAAQSNYATLDANHVLAPVDSRMGALWSAQFTGNAAGLQVPRATGGTPAKSTVFTAGLWLGGEDQSRQLYVAAETYRQGSPPDRGFFAGPMATGFATPGDDPDYNYAWKVTRAEINTHRASYTQPGYQLPASLRTWPARRFGYTGISALAPFVDTNADGYYDPQDGDYPDVPGDQAIFTISNDAAGVKEPFSPAMGMEVQTLVYAFNSGACSSALDETVFVRYKITNHSSRSYRNMYAGHWVDFDLGYSNDDYVGVDSAQAMGYAYNGDLNDEGTTGYGLTPPAQGVMALNMPLYGFQYYNNDFSATGMPLIAQHYYNYLRGQWKDGRAVKYGGDGLLNTTPRSTTFMYPGDPVTNTGWTEAHPLTTTSPNLPGDRRAILTFKLDSLGPSDVRTIDLAYVYARGAVGIGDNLSSVAALYNAAANVKNCYVSSVGLTEDATVPAFALYPNPAHGTAYLSWDAAPAGHPVEIIDVLGRTLRTYPVAPQASHLTLDLRGLTPGLYTVRCGAAARRLVVE